MFSKPDSGKPEFTGERRRLQDVFVAEIERAEPKRHEWLWPALQMHEFFDGEGVAASQHPIDGAHVLHVVERIGVEHDEISDHADGVCREP
jgi:hypothetical protein